MVVSLTIRMRRHGGCRFHQQDTTTLASGGKEAVLRICGTWENTMVQRCELCAKSFEADPITLLRKGGTTVCRMPGLHPAGPAAATGADSTLRLLRQARTRPGRGGSLQDKESAQ